MADYKIELGVHVRTNEIRKQISAYNTNSNNAKLQLGVKLDTADLKKQIQSLNASGGIKGLLSVDTKTLEISLDRIANDIKEIRTAFGTLDGSAKMGNLLTSINQISTALDNASKQFIELNTQLNSLAGKNFGVNVGVNMGGGNAVSRNAAYGSMARGEIIPQLQQQVTALENYLARYYKVADGINGVNKLIQGTGVVTAANHPYTLLPQMADGSNLSKQMGALKQYITLIKEAAAVKGVDLTPVTSTFTQSADQLVTKAQNVQSGTVEMEESFKRLQGLFGSGINAERLSTQLDSIVTDLGEIRTALQGMTQNASLDSLTASFNNLSASLEKLVGNATQAQNILNNGLNTSGASAGTKKAIQEQEQLAQTTTQTANTVAQSGQKIQQAFNQMAGASNLDPVQLKDDVTEANELTLAITRLKQVMTGIGKIQIGQISTSKGVTELKVLETQLESLSAEYNETVAEINRLGGMGSQPMQQMRGQMESTARTIEQLKGRIVDVKAQLASGIQANFGNYEAQIVSLEGKFDKLATKPQEVRVGLDTLRQALTTLKSADGTDAIISANDRYLAILKQVNAQINLNAAAERNADSSIALQQQKQALALKMSNWLRDNSAAAKQFGSEIQKLQVQLKSCGNTDSVRQIGRDFQNVAMQAQEAGLTALSFGDRLKRQFSQYSAYFSVASMIMYGIQGLRSMFEQVKLIDSAMTELKKVTNETAESYNQFLTNAAKRSKEIGTTIDGLVSSTADFARLGYGFEDAQGLAEVANIYAVVGDEIEGVEGATESLISTMAAFKDEMNGMSNTDFAMSIIDKFNEIGNNFAISSGGIGEALERSASSLMAANNTIDESIALITASNQVVQDPEAVGKWLADIKSGYIG